MFFSSLHLKTCLGLKATNDTWEGFPLVPHNLYAQRDLAGAHTVEFVR